MIRGEAERAEHDVRYAAAATTAAPASPGPVIRRAVTTGTAITAWGAVTIRGSISAPAPAPAPAVRPPASCGSDAFVEEAVHILPDDLVLWGDLKQAAISA